MRRLVGVAVLAVLTVSGCSGGGSTSSPASTAATVGAPAGVPAPQDLTAFRCDATDDDAWVAAGFVQNTGKGRASYQVTVYVGPADGQARPARTQQVDDLAAGDSQRFEIDGISAAGDVCHVQLLRTV